MISKNIWRRVDISNAQINMFQSTILRIMFLPEKFYQHS